MKTPDPDGPTWMASDASQVERRGDPDDLTPFVSRLTQAERDEHKRLRWQFRACVAFWILAGGFAVVLICWGVRQLL